MENKENKFKILLELLKKRSKGIKDKDVEKVINSADEIKKKFKKGSPLERLIEDGKLLISMVKDYWSGEYRNVPWWAISAVVFALLYVLSPIDFIPDMIPVAGLTDDAAVVSACIYLVGQQLQDYKDWKSGNSNKGDLEADQVVKV